jgi:signal transduction histidine kinase
MSVSAVRGADGGVEYFVALLSDISNHRMAQEQLQVSSRLAALGTLVAGVAHEINNPLAGCMASLGLAIEDLREFQELAARGQLLDRDETPRRIAGSLEVLAEASAATQRIARIVRDLTIFGRPDPRRTRMRLIDAVDEAMRWLPAAVATSATVQVENAGARDVVGSVGQIGQVVVNLVTNAARSIPAGRRGRITVRIGNGNRGMSRLEVVDNGSGIPADVMKRIFDPFFTTRKVGQGMGLGLPVCHAIVTAHGGTITARSHPGAGSCFTIELPAAPPES